MCPMLFRFLRRPAILAINMSRGARKTVRVLALARMVTVLELTKFHNLRSAVRLSLGAPGFVPQGKLARSIEVLSSSYLDLPEMELLPSHLHGRLNLAGTGLQSLTLHCSILETLRQHYQGQCVEGQCSEHNQRCACRRLG